MPTCWLRRAPSPHRKHQHDHQRTRDLPGPVERVAGNNDTRPTRTRRAHRRPAPPRTRIRSRAASRPARARDAACRAARARAAAPETEQVSIVQPARRRSPETAARSPDTAWRMPYRAGRASSAATPRVRPAPSDGSACRAASAPARPWSAFCAAIARCCCGGVGHRAIERGRRFAGIRSSTPHHDGHRGKHVLRLPARLHHFVELAREHRGRIVPGRRRRPSGRPCTARRTESVSAPPPSP